MNCPDPPSSPDINHLLGAEQTAIMQADAAGEGADGTGHRARAEAFGDQLEQSTFPHRIPQRYGASLADETAPNTASPEPGSPEDLGLTKNDSPDKHWDDGKKIEDDGEPFDNLFA